MPAFVCLSGWHRAGHGFLGLKTMKYSAALCRSCVHNISSSGQSQDNFYSTLLNIVCMTRFIVLTADVPFSLLIRLKLIAKGRQFQKVMG